MYRDCRPHWPQPNVFTNSVLLIRLRVHRSPYARPRNAPLVARLVKRAQAAGQLRAGLQPTDIPFLVFLLTDAAQFARETSPEIWRRYLTLVLDGLRPEREGVTPLPVAALSPEEFELSMRQDPPRGH